MQSFLRWLMWCGDNMKTCQSTRAVPGCGKQKREEEFQRTKNNGRMKVCAECILNYRRGTITIRHKYETSEETELYSQFDKLMR